MAFEKLDARLPPVVRALWQRLGASGHLAAARRAARRAMREVRLRDPWIYEVARGRSARGDAPLCLHYVGRRRFAADFHAFFARGESGAPDLADRQERALGAQAVWTHLRRLGAWPEDADLLVVDGMCPTVPSRAEGPDYVPFIEARLKVAADIEGQLAQVRSKGQRRKLAQALKRPFAWRKSHAESDFDAFYDRMYAPFVKERFRFEGSIVGREDMRRVFLRRGFLLLVEEEGQAVAGALMYVPEEAPGSLAYWKYGLADVGSLSPALFGERNGMTEAMVLRYAIEHHFAEIDFGLTRALPFDGIFTHKKRLGCDFTLPPEFTEFRLRTRAEVRPTLFAGQPVVVAHQGTLTAWMGHSGELGAGGQEALGEALRAACFPSLGGLELFVDAKEPASRAAIEEVLSALTVEQGAAFAARARWAPDKGP